MKKYGKYEKRPEGAPVKEQKVKNPLLQTYFTSLLCMVLCVTMFLGTSYAWFTSEVENTGNEIYIGTLDVDLQDEDGNSYNGSGKKLFDGSIRWEPGYTAMETIKVVNEGDLAFRYVLTFADGKLTSSQDTALLRTVAENFVVYVHEGAYAEGETAPMSFTDIEESETWAPVKMGEKEATLADILEKELPVISGNMEDVRTDGTDATVPEGAGPSDSKDTEATYIIALHMKESAGQDKDGNDSSEESKKLMGQRIALNVKLTAYQMSSETDGLGTQYDQMVATADELKEAFKEGGTIALAADIVAENVETLAAVPSDKEVVLYLNGHDINVKLADPGTNTTELFYVHAGGKLTINGSDDSKVHVVAGKSSQKVSAVINNCSGTVVINGGTYTMEYGSYNDGYLAPLMIDNNSTSGKTTTIINGGNFTHTRNMFRNFANHETEVASIIINGGTFNGTEGDAGAIWNQKPSTSIPAGAGVVELNGGTFNYMTVCTGFADETGNAAGVTADDGVSLGNWEADNGEWVATINS